MKTKIAVLGGGPGAEREVSIQSSTAVTHALKESGLDATLVLIDAPDALAGIHADVIVPVLHGRWGEGGPLQDILETDGRPYFGSGPITARLCMDKLATKLLAARLGIATPQAMLLNISDRIGIDLPYVIKPALEGSSVGLHICYTDDEARSGFEVSCRDIIANPGQVTMVEKLITGREITCSVIERDGTLETLPLIEICPAGGVYDYEAKYDRDDTRYLLDPPGIDSDRIKVDTLKLASAAGVRHLARADFIVDEAGCPWLLEINTMPGFTAHSLVPQAAAHAGLRMADLCAHLVHTALTGDRASSLAPDSSK